MNKILMIAAGIAALGFVAMTTLEALAACPPGTSYQCHQGYNGKVICSCS